MDYGLNVTDLIYTDENRYDLGTLADYEVDLDLAGDKDFELSVDEFVIPERGFWYVDGKEYGGIIDGFETDSSSGYRIKYKGRSWRGILNSRVIYAGDGKGSISIGGEISQCVNELLKTYDLSSLFICDKVDLNAAENRVIQREILVDENGYYLVDETGAVLTEFGEEDIPINISETAIPIGKTVYEAMIILADSLGFNYEFRYNLKDKKVHIVPGITIDYTDFLTYSVDNSVKFKFIRNGNITNHLICCGEDEDGKRRLIHLFTDESGTIQPYAKTNKPVKDSDYILDDSKKVIKGVREIAEFLETNSSAEENYVLLSSQPSDWARNYMEYYIKKINQTAGQKQIVTVNHNCLVFLSYTATKGHLQIKQGDHLLIENFDYWIQGRKDEGNVIEFHSNYRNEPVTIAPLTDGEDSYESIPGINKDVYTALYSPPTDWPNTYMYYYKRSWNQSNREYEYSAVSANTELDYSRVTKISSKPSDWAVNYGQYYYYFQTGTNRELRTYSSSSEDNYIVLPNKPDDWDTNVSSYYKKQYTIKTSDGTETNYDSYVRGSTVTWASLQNNSSGYPPAFYKNKYYRRDSKTVIPAFNASNCYLPGSRSSTPEFNAGAIFRKTPSVVAPPFERNKYYIKYIDHFFSMVEAGKDHFENLKSQDSQNVELGNVNMNIGDTVGGRDDVTGFVTIEKITNVIIKIKRGILDAEYEIGGR